MTFWLDDLRRLLGSGTPVMALQIAAVRGSSPRGPGARMLVTADGAFGTIGGGALEWEATAEARTRLARAGSGAVDHVTLGPEIGQCCGGAVTLVYEPYAPADLAWVERLAASVGEPGAVFRIFELRPGKGASRAFVGDRGRSGDCPDWAVRMIGDLTAGGGRFQAVIGGEHVRLVEHVAPDATPLWLFGAGHVGRAVVRALDPLPFAITWVDGRLDAFPEDVSGAVRTLSLAVPELIVDEAPAGAFFLVMTHSHALDFEICEAVLRRGDAGYLGLIGSKTKRATLVARLRKAGIGDGAIAQLTCPIGLPGIAGKEPAVIAASVAADLLIRAGKTAAHDRPVEESR